MPVHLNHSLLNPVTPNQRLLRLRTTHPAEWCSVVQRFWAGTKCPLGTKLRPSYLFSHRSVFNLSLGLHDKKSESDAIASPPLPLLSPKWHFLSSGHVYKWLSSAALLGPLLIRCKPTSRRE